VNACLRARVWQSQSGGIISSLLSLVFVVVLCAVLYLARGPLLRLVGESWVVEDPLERADAIIVLSDDNFYADRAARAADLYRHNLAPLVVASGRRLRPYAGIAELMEHDLIERGVPKDRILVFPHNADNTKEEAQALLQPAVERKWRSVIVVTSNYHTRRARYIFLKMFPQQIAISVAASKGDDFDPEHWWQTRKSLKELTREVAGMVVAMWELRGARKSSTATPAVVGLCALSPQYVV
jgi:uncharacterized SAM-binding protein YcdF (DUF218 family)